ncbi:hypothetical protein ABN222_04650 [Providencia alcalifaciens]
MPKRPLTFDSDALRSFVTGIELGSFALAAAAAGLGITLRTKIGVPSSLQLYDLFELPDVGYMGVNLHRAEEKMSEAVASLYHTITEFVADKIIA